MSNYSIQQAEPEKVLVCVTRQRQCEELIRQGAALAEKAHLPLAVVNVQRPGYLAGEEAELLDFLMEVTRQVGGELFVLYDENPLKGILRYAKEHRVRAVILGHSPQGQNPLAMAMEEALPGVAIMQSKT